ncbi:MAG: tryptophan 7-halogenase [Alphaproteobacteria bacterium]|nr:tryptophan 7-halogenase [Alphaproteobacteria bacterium]
MPDGGVTVTAPPIGRVLVAGGGIVGWSAAAALRKRIPALAVTVVPLPPPEDALADRIQSCLPPIINFHDDLGLTEADTVVRAGSGFRLGTAFEGWTMGRSAYVHAYGEHGRPFGTASFHQHWVRAALAGEAEAFNAYSPAAALARAGRFTHPAGPPGTPLAGFAFGLTLTPTRYHHLMRAFALHLGSVEREGAIARVRLAGESGCIEAVEMADGTALEADLFVDATGPRALLRSALGLRLEDWGRWLPCDRFTMAEGPADAGEPPLLDTAAAEPAGWRWRSASPLLATEGRLFSAAHAGAAEGVPLRQGRVAQPWLKNCVAIGDAAVRVEPLEWTNLHLAHSGIDRLVAMMPARDFNPVELWDYNRQAATEADRVRDFLALHYLASERPDPFWREAAAAEPPPSLAHTLALFRARGRLPFYEEETFGRDAWLAVLLGQGVMPRASDPLIDVVPPRDSAAAMAALRSGIAGLVPGVPSHAATLQTLSRQAAR